MINSATIVGRLTKDLELKKTKNNKSYLQFSLACDDPHNKEHTDFINCVVWNQGADFLSQHAHKGDVIGCSGKISTRSYDGQNGKVYVTEVLANRVCIAGTSRKNQNAAQPSPDAKVYYDETQYDDDSEMIEDDDLPFY